MSKPRLLFISPVAPNPSNQGSPMRAFTFLQALADRFDVCLLLYGKMLLGPQSAVDESVWALCSHIFHVPLLPRRDPFLFLQLRLRKYLNGLWMLPPLNYPSDWIPLSPKMKNTLKNNRLFNNIDIIHVYRMTTLPLLSRLSALNPQARLFLDMDDIESKTRHRFSELYKQHRERRRARAMAYDRALYEKIEANTMHLFERIFICSQTDKAFLETNHIAANITVVPNTVAIPSMESDHPTGDVFTLLFIGNLNYYPNQEGIVWFAHQVLPLIRRMTNRSLRLNVVGKSSNKVLKKTLAAIPEVNLMGHVPDVSPWYSRAHAAIAPLRAGGGTRIKILEAFAHKRPLVSTSIGIEGISAQPDHHFLRADDPAEFARQCCRLASDDALWHKLSQNAFSLVSQAYHSGVAHRIIRDCFRTGADSPGTTIRTGA